MFLEIALYSLFVQPTFCLIFIEHKNKGFPREALPRMTPSSPSVEDFGTDIQKQIT